MIIGLSVKIWAARGKRERGGDGGREMHQLSRREDVAGMSSDKSEREGRVRRYEEKGRKPVGRPNERRQNHSSASTATAFGENETQTPQCDGARTCAPRSDSAAVQRKSAGCRHSTPLVNSQQSVPAPSANERLEAGETAEAN